MHVHPRLQEQETPKRDPCIRKESRTGYPVNYSSPRVSETLAYIADTALPMLLEA